MAPRAQPAPRHLRPDQRQHAAKCIVERTLGHEAADHRTRRPIVDLALELTDLVVELCLGLAHFRTDDSRFAIHSEFSFNVVTVSSGTACTPAICLRPDAS